MGLEPQQWEFQYGRDSPNEGLSRSKYQAAFLGLFEDINRAVKSWKPRDGITRKQLDRINLRKGMARDSGSFPHIELAFSIEDRLDDIMGSGHPFWTLGRKLGGKQVRSRFWLMPDFGFWVWHNPGLIIGTYNEVVEKIKKQENVIAWTKKERKLV
ncbi:hypothetical protein ACJ73_07695 [Blastomyces percursus]|uniref:Uncharacterized protein n=1 Tax=Blastomyces percursus TaxID=1658174 RepID=A0A1J9PX90_9EURO|nr:hypothetical protein ACJ73_07695 [Blastomyces percursus]